MTEHSLVFVAAVFGLAGGVKGLSGMGLPTVAIGLLSFVMPPATAASLLVIPSLATNLVQCFGAHTRVLVRRLWPLWLAIFVGAFVSPLPSLADAGSAVRLMLGAVLAAYGAWGLLGRALPGPGRHEGILSVAAGYVNGVITAATGVYVLPLMPYLQALQLPREAMIQAMGLSFTVCTLAMALRLGGAQVAAEAFTVAGAVALFAAFAGLYAGSQLRRHLNAGVFRRVLFAAFVALGVMMAGKELLGSVG
ncbi:MAG: sulfite exporter TauE/SafE family protein [Hydrogenophaga sp.]|nr:sulfite exporter TauE/SafE family protein [Hydrogenophaga sp.]